MIAFRRLNLVAEPWPIRTTFDCIFCRNVVIYFDRPTQQRLFGRLADHLNPDGCLFVGHSENLHTATDRFVPLGNTIYRSKASTGADEPETATIAVGDVFASARPACVTTLLGSCVAACLFDPESRVGGMNHFMLPDGVGGGADSARFGVHAMELLIDAILARGGDRSRLQAKIFGGSASHPAPGRQRPRHRRQERAVRRGLPGRGVDPDREPIARRLRRPARPLHDPYRQGAGQAVQDGTGARQTSRAAGSEARRRDDAGVSRCRRPGRDLTPLPD